MMLGQILFLLCVLTGLWVVFAFDGKRVPSLPTTVFALLCISVVVLMSGSYDEFYTYTTMTSQGEADVMISRKVCGRGRIIGSWHCDAIVTAKCVYKPQSLGRLSQTLTTMAIQDYDLRKAALMQNTMAEIGK